MIVGGLPEGNCILENCRAEVESCAPSYKATLRMDKHAAVLRPDGGF